jgi:maltoporin
MKNAIRITALSSAVLLSLSVNANTADGFSSHGYMNYGTGFTNDPVLNEAAYQWGGSGGNIFRLPGMFHADTSGGRLGNDGNWIQVHGDYGITKNDMNWGAHLMFSSNFYPDNFVPEWAYVDGVGVIPSMPDATVWAGQRYLNRVSTPLVVNEALASDGRGAGIQKIDTGFAMLDLSVTRNLYNSYEGYMHQGDTVLFSSALRGIDIADGIDSEIYLNYGTYIGPNSNDEIGTSGQTHKEAAPDSYQAGIKFNHNAGDLSHQVFLRYSSNARQVATREWWQPVPSSLAGGFLYGKYQLTDNYRLEYTYAHETEGYDEKARETVNPYRAPMNAVESNWDSLIVRNTYGWNERTSTAIELGYEQIRYLGVDPSDDGTNSGYKATLSQQIHIGSGEWDRPVINFYVTYVEQDVETKVYDAWGIDNSAMGKSDAMTVGVQFEAWW